MLTSAFSHAEADHLFTNMIGLYFFGTSVRCSLFCSVLTNYDVETCNFVFLFVRFKWGIDMQRVCRTLGSTSSVFCILKSKKESREEISCELLI